MRGIRQGKVDQMRYTLAAEYRFNRTHEIGFYYQLQQWMNRTHNNRYFVLGVQYTFSLP